MINLQLEINEVNMILAVLGKHPFEEVVALVSKIKTQGDPQAQAIADAAQAIADAAPVESAPVESAPVESAPT
jgi:hypothetical protein